MSPVVVEPFTTEEALARREEILAEVGGGEDTFRARAEAYVLEARELALFDELEELDYLLGR